VLQAIKIVRQTQQQGLAALRKQTATRSAARQFAFGNGENSFNQRATAVFLTRKMVSHLGTNAVKGPGLFPALGGDDAQSMQLLADESVVTLGVELGIGQHAADRSVGMGLSDQSGQVGTIVPRGLTVPTAPR